eukprot:4850666-Prymnesium_polylepis.2
MRLCLRRRWARARAKLATSPRFTANAPSRASSRSPAPTARSLQVTNLGALRLYEGLGFVRDKRLHRYYLNGNDAYRLKVWFKRPVALAPPAPPPHEEAAAAAEAVSQEMEAVTVE